MFTRETSRTLLPVADQKHAVEKPLTTALMKKILERREEDVVKTFSAALSDEKDNRAMQKSFQTELAHLVDRLEQIEAQIGVLIQPGSATLPWDTETDKTGDAFLAWQKRKMGELLTLPVSELLARHQDQNNRLIDRIQILIDNAELKNGFATRDALETAVSDLILVDVRHSYFHVSRMKQVWQLGRDATVSGQ